MDWFRRSPTPTAAALGALAALLILPAIHGAESPHRGQIPSVFALAVGGPATLAPPSPLGSSDAARPCPLCLALAHSRAAAADAAGALHPDAPLPDRRLERLPAPPGPFRLSLATLAPRAPPAAA